MNFAILKRELKGNIVFILVFVILGTISGNSDRNMRPFLDSFENMFVFLSLSIMPLMAFFMHLSQTYLKEHEDGKITILLNSPNSRPVIFFSKFVSSLVIALIIYLLSTTIKSALWIGESQDLFFSNAILRENFRIFLFHSSYLFILYLLFIGGLVTLIYQIKCTFKLGIALSVAYASGSVIYEGIYVSALVQGAELPVIAKILRFVFYQFFFTIEFRSGSYLDLGFNSLITHLLAPALSLLFLLAGVTLFSRKDIKI